LLIRNLRGLDFGFGGLPPTARLFSKLTWGTLTVPPIHARKIRLREARRIAANIAWVVGYGTEGRFTA
jgi:hypothetical protein